MRLLESAIGGNYDYYHLLTGVDLPLKSNDEIDQFFRQNNGAEFISFDREANETGNFVRRYDGYHFNICILAITNLIKIQADYTLFLNMCLSAANALNNR